MLVDGDARVACVTPAARIAGRSVTTLAGLGPSVQEPLADAFVATGGSQCGFCTPGILVRLAALFAKHKIAPADLERALAAHLCRCTGWQTITEAVDLARDPGRDGAEPRDLMAAARRAELEGGSPQGVGRWTPLGDAGFADDTAPRDALVAVPRPPGSAAEAVDASGIAWVIGETLDDARRRAGKVQGRRSTVADTPPLPFPDLPTGGVRLATSWVEPGYLEPDASWCQPAGTPATPLANGGAFGGKTESPVGPAARILADQLGRTVRTVFAREDVVRLGPKRPPIAASAVAEAGRVVIRGVSPGAAPSYESPYEGLAVAIEWAAAAIPGPPVSTALRAAGRAELTVLVEGAIDAAGWDRSELVGSDDRSRAVLLDTLAVAESGARAGARVGVDDTTGIVSGIEVRVDAGDPLDPVVLRSYAIGAAHMALGWVLSEGIAVDPETGEVLDLTIRSFGIVRPKSMPPVLVEIVPGDGPAVPGGSDAVFAAVAAATWNAVARIEGVRPERFPAAETRAARMLRR
ncbi:MAG: molybdopterin-dependent oxidoreductase [Acidimicrobiia bacterium]|nr:molybdopterin-dependent oxidoreductase [Acidimicrobiia bacterium]